MLPEKALFFGLTCLGFGFIPGPALLQTVSLTLQHGRRVGFLSALGSTSTPFSRSASSRSVRSRC